MGICSSYDSATHAATAKIILQDGKLQEFSYPVKASYVLQKYPASFICNSDEMDFDDVVSAISDDEELQPGQLYFALPLSKLHYPLQAEEIAALAVKASAALMRSGDKCGCHKKSVCPVVFSGEQSLRKATSIRRVPGAGLKRRGRRNFTALLSAIPE